MGELTSDAIQEIERIHSDWVAHEVAGQTQKLMALCADDIELWPPDAEPVIGLTAVAARMATGTTKIHSIEITDRRIRGSGDISYLTANYKTTLSSADDPTPQQLLGSHLWILRTRSGTWTIDLISWSCWDHEA